ncbi:MAG: hypothetical protein ACLQGV_12795 [Bryobacteraceae bacterium]
MSKPKRSESGAAMIEGALSTLLWVPLLLGTLYYGTEFVTALQVVQVTRDAGHMFARGVNFTTSSTNSNQILLARLGYQLGLATFTGSAVTGVNTSGSMVIILTKIQNVSANACTAWAGSTTCPNLNKWVVTQQLIIGNSALRGSNYAQDPLPASELDSTSGTVLPETSGGSNYYYLGDTKLQLQNFNLIQCDATTLTTGFPQDTPAYMAEAFVQTPGIPNVGMLPGSGGGGGIYSMDIF